MLTDNMRNNEKHCKVWIWSDAKTRQSCVDFDKWKSALFVTPRDYAQSAVGGRQEWSKLNFWLLAKELLRITHQKHVRRSLRSDEAGPMEGIRWIASIWHPNSALYVSFNNPYQRYLFFNGKPPACSSKYQRTSSAPLSWKYQSCPASFSFT